MPFLTAYSIDVNNTVTAGVPIFDTSDGMLEELFEVRKRGLFLTFPLFLKLKKNVLPRQAGTDTGKAQKERDGFLAGDRRGWQRHDLLSGVQDLPVDGGGSNCHWQQ
eukprot:COSAG06_NODE_685_length_13103_cov_126.328668_8_plen_107_part_00